MIGSRDSMPESLKAAWALTSAKIAVIRLYLPIEKVTEDPPFDKCQREDRFLMLMIRDGGTSWE